jgi:hypothetical protein
MDMPASDGLASFRYHARKLVGSACNKRLLGSGRFAECASYDTLKAISSMFHPIVGVYSAVQRCKSHKASVLGGEVSSAPV